MNTTSIEWTEKSWNPITGCTPVSEGCRNCYAKRMAERLKGRFGYPADDPFRVTFHPDRLYEPLKIRKPSTIFVCSMGDLFHADVQREWRHAIYDVIEKTPQHKYIILTKRPQNIMSWWFGKLQENVVVGVSVESQKTADERIPKLLKAMPIWKRVVSIEPMLGPINFKLRNTGFMITRQDVSFKDWDTLAGKCGNLDVPHIDGVIVGGESGHNARPMHPDWARKVRDDCAAAGVPFYFKQWGEWAEAEDYAGYPYLVGDGKYGKSISNKLCSHVAVNLKMARVGKKAAGRVLDGRTHDELCWKEEEQ